VVIPAQLHGPLEPIKAINHSQRKSAGLDTCISEWMKVLEEIVTKNLLDLVDRVLFTDEKISG